MPPPQVLPTKLQRRNVQLTRDQGPPGQFVHLNCAVGKLRVINSGKPLGKLNRYEARPLAIGELRIISRPQSASRNRPAVLTSAIAALAEAALVIARASISQSELPNDVEERVEVTVRALQSFVYNNEAALRMLAPIHMKQPLAGKPTEKDDPVPARGNRVKFIAPALAGVRGRLASKEFDRRLVSALVLCMGIEAAMALRYVRNLSVSQATDICSWAAQQILKGALEDSAQS